MREKSKLMPLMDLATPNWRHSGGFGFFKGIDHHVSPKGRRFIKKRGIRQKHTTSHISRNDLPGRVSIFGNFWDFWIFKILFSENAEQNFPPRWISESRIFPKMDFGEQNFSQDGFRRAEFFSHKDGFRRKCRAEQILKDALDWGKCD